MWNLARYVVVSTLASAAVIYHAFYTREQYFPSMVYLSTSKLCVAVLCNMAFACALCFYRLVTHLFLGRLREAELERLNERVSSAVMETCLAMTIFREEFNIVFVVMFATATFVKVFHWLLQDRVDYLETTPNIPRLQHFRTTSFMTLLLMVDVAFLNFTVHRVIQSGGRTVMLLFAFEYLIQISSIFSSIGKYTFAALDGLLQGHWESKGVYVFYLELMRDLFHLCVYLVFFCIVLTQYGLPIHLVRDLYWTIRNFRNRVRDFLRYRRITSRIDFFPDANEEDLARCGNVCIICREEMTLATVNKKLPCGHVFHVHCLRSWLERQQNCPICRSPVLPPRETTVPAPQNENGRGQGEAPEAEHPIPPIIPNLNEANEEDAHGQVPNNQIPPANDPVPQAPNPGSLPVQDPNQGPRPSLMQQRLPPQWGGGQQFGFVWNYPNVLPTTSMATFVNGQIQYAGQQNPEPVMNHSQQGLHGVPIVPIMSSFSAPITLLAPPGTAPERHQMAAAAAVAAAAYTPHAGLVMMPPVTYIPSSNAETQSNVGEGSSSSENTTAAQAAAAASAASGMAAAFSQTQPWNPAEQATMEATMQVLQRQMEFLQAQMTRSHESQPDQREENIESTSAEASTSTSVPSTAFSTTNERQDTAVTSSQNLEAPPLQAAGESGDPETSELRRRRIQKLGRQEENE